MAIAHELTPTVPWDVSWWTIIVEAFDPLDPTDWNVRLCANRLARNSGSGRSSITIARQFPTPAAVSSKASPNRSYAQRVLASFERLHVGNALTLTEETLRSGHRFELEYILGSFCERTSKKCGHASLFARILHNLLSLRSRSLRPSVNRRVYPADCSPPIRYPAIRPWLGMGPNDRAAKACSESIAVITIAVVSFQSATRRGT